MRRLYQLALRAFPRRHRDLYGGEMIDAFDRDLTARAGLARLSFGFAACLNAIGTGLVERQRQRRIRKGPALSALDFTLAWRMLLRYPGLSLVSVLGMSVGITIAAGAFTIAWPNRCGPGSISGGGAAPGKRNATKTSKQKPARKRKTMSAAQRKAVSARMKKY